ncbi:MAG: HindVP family restriction endonuclease [Corynebacterium sp.]|uniref:HindVP family restriction endonuclease n=1 Tax=Corynebacterium sp. TaxID=1720 RepID=UPI0026DB968B|nr:HindVP family restriction endonuclease [Corynebacterium sp.]MDO5030623.1 HindVP family restriction endonuclease [Corynebacterium sp.]
MAEPYLYGLSGNHDFTNTESLGKNVFTNAFPLALAQYMDQQRGLKLPLISAKVDARGDITTEHIMTPWSEIIETESTRAKFLFETVFDQFDRYTHTSANKSDVVVINERGEHRRAFEVKLVVVPTSSTASRPREEQSCEIVFRPSSIEQLAFSIAHSYGAERRFELLDIITKVLIHPIDFDWSNREFMADKIDLFIEAAEALIAAGVSSQTPLVLIAIWRTVGQTPKIDNHAFDTFVATDLGFLVLLLNTVKRGKKTSQITRPQRSLIWLIHALWQYGMQRSLNFPRTHEKLAYGPQTDKAGSFANVPTREFIMSPEFINPRVSREERHKILAPEAVPELMPERRLDQSLWIQDLLEGADIEFLGGETI